MANKRVSDIAEELEVGQAVEAKILDIDTEKRESASVSSKLCRTQRKIFTEEAEEYYPEEDEEFSGRIRTYDFDADIPKALERLSGYFL